MRTLGAWLRLQWGFGPGFAWSAAQLARRTLAEEVTQVTRPGYHNPPTA
jgi:hypothetical protein